VFSSEPAPPTPQRNSGNMTKSQVFGEPDNQPVHKSKNNENRAKDHGKEFLFGKSGT
jgi:hypothetical protein